MTLRPRHALVATLAALAGVLAACGVSTKGADRSVPQTTPKRTNTTSGPALGTVRLPQRPKGVIAVDGSTSGSLTPAEARVFRKAGVNVSVGNSGSDFSLLALCRGQIDVADVSRVISASEARLCQQNGLSFVQLLIASDAVVVATKNEADVGGDCLTLRQVRAVFQRGSTIRNWRQLNFFDLPLTTTGPRDNTPLFEAFAKQALGIPRGATLGEVRADYRATTNQDASRRLVINSALVKRAQQIAGAKIGIAATKAGAQEVKASNKAQAKAAKAVVRQIQRENKQREKLKQSVKNKAALIRQNARRVDQAKRSANLRVLGDFRRRQFAREAAIRNAELAKADRPGVVGLFGFTYYENFEDQLRPIEVDLAARGQRHRNCIFPSQSTVTDGSYPLANRLLLYTTTRAIKRPEVKAFLTDYITNAPALAAQSRLVPLPDNQVQRQLLLVKLGGRLPQPRPVRRTTTTRRANPAPPRTTTTP